MSHCGNFASMSRPMFQRYLLYYLTATAILVYGSSQRTIRRASCPSCSQDCPEALASPWYPRRGSNLQAGILQDFSIIPYRNSPYFRLAHRDISQNTVDDHIFSSQNPISSRRYRSFSQQGPINGYLHVNRGYPSTQFVDKSEEQRSSLGNFPKFTEFLGKQTILSLDKPVNSYPFARVSPSGQLSSESEQENPFFRNPRDKYSMSSPENFEVSREDKEDLAGKFSDVYRADEKPSWKNSKHAFSNKIVSDKFFPTFQISILDKDKEKEISAIEKSPTSTRQQYISPTFHQISILDKDEEKNPIERSPISANQQYNLVFPQNRYHSVGFDMPKVQHESYVLSEDSDVQKPAKDGEVYGNFMKDSLGTSSLGQMKWIRNDFSEAYPAEEEKMVAVENDNEQIDYPYDSPQDLYIWRPVKDEMVFPDNWNIATDNNLQDFTEIKQLKEAENNRPQVYSTMEKDVKYFNNKEDKDWKYFEDGFDKDTTQTETSTYNSYTIFPNMNIWRPIQDEELSDKLDFTFRGGLKGIQNTEQSETYPVEKNNNKYFQDENRYTIQDETRVDADRIIRAPVINVNPYIFPQLPSNILNAPKNPIPIVSSITKDFSSGIKNNIQRVNPTENIHGIFFKDKKIVMNDERNQDQIFVKDTYDAKEYNNSALDRKLGQIKDNNKTQDENLTKLDPDLTDEVEIPPTESTEPTPKESFERHSTSTTKNSS